jgi:DNA (cytosine-5)-methyltransferase 1
MGEGKTTEEWDAWTEKMRAKHNNGNGHGRSLAIEAQRLLPENTSSDVPLRLLPTPRANSERSSRRALTRVGHWSAPSLAQAVELAQGVLPREYEDWSEVQGWHGASTPQPSSDGNTSSDDPPRLPPTTEDD